MVYSHILILQGWDDIPLIWHISISRGHHFFSTLDSPDWFSMKRLFLHKSRRNRRLRMSRHCKLRQERTQNRYRIMKRILYGRTREKIVRGEKKKIRMLNSLKSSTGNGL